MNLNDFKRLIQPLRNKIFLLLGRAVLEAVKNTELTQKIQITALNEEVISDMERFQEYGFETYPLEGSEVVAVFLNGNRDHGIAICVHNRDYRPKDLVEGEVAVYTDEDGETDGHRAHFKRSQILEIKNKELIIHSKTKVEINTENAVVNCSGKATIKATTGCDIDGGAGNLGHVITEKSGCPFTGIAHLDPSTDVTASK